MTHWGIPLTALNAASVTSPIPVTGTAIDLGEVRDVHAIEVIVSSFSGSGYIDTGVMGSLDGVNWYGVGSVPGAATGDGVFIAQSTVPARYLQGFAEQFFATTPTATVSVVVASGTS